MAYHKVNIGFFVAYMIGMTGVMIFTGIGITPDRYALVLILGSLLLKKTRSFLIDWLPFIFILVAYDFLRGLAPILNPNVHYTEMIRFDEWLFGTNPILFLQEKFYQAGKTTWVDIVAVFVYFLHFALPLGFGFIFWIKNRIMFKRFANALLILSYMAFFTYVLFPASPPWLAEDKGYLPGVVKILDGILKLFPTYLQLPTIYHSFNPNPVAAVPSLHASYPLLILFFAVQVLGKKAWVFSLYVLAAWFSLVYLGEHYVFDIVVGVIYTVIVYFFTSWMARHKRFNQA